MKVAIIGGSGNAGRAISTELAQRGHQVTAISRHPENAPGDPQITAVAGDVNDTEAMRDLLAGHDVVVSSVHFSVTDPAELVDLIRTSGVPRYLIVGGAGSLEVEPGVMRVDQPGIPPEYLPEIRRGVAFLGYLRGVSDVDWTFVSPSLIFFDGPRTGTFRLGGDQMIVDDEGNSRISFADYAVAFADEIEKPQHIRGRFTVGY